MSPEEVYAARFLCGGSNVNPCDWLTSELPHLLDEVCAMAASVQLSSQAGGTGARSVVDGDGCEAQQDAATEGVRMSRAEAKLAWLAAGGDTERAARQMLRDRKVKVGQETPPLPVLPHPGGAKPSVGCLMVEKIIRLSRISFFHFIKSFKLQPIFPKC